jgi:hypothetical protein
VSSHCASWLSHRLLSSPHCATLSSSSRASWFSHRLSLSSHCAAFSSSCHASWLLHCLSPSSVLLLRHPLVNSSRQLVVAASPCPLVAPRAALSSSHRSGWLLRRLLTCRPLVLLSSCRAASCCLVAPAGCRAIISLRPLIAPPSRPNGQCGRVVRPTLKVAEVGGSCPCETPLLE